MNGAHSSGTPTDMDLTKAKTYPKKPTDKWVVTKVKTMQKPADMDLTKAKTKPNKPAARWVMTKENTYRDVR